MTVNAKTLPQRIWRKLYRTSWRKLFCLYVRKCWYGETWHRFLLERWRNMHWQPSCNLTVTWPRSTALNKSEMYYSLNLASVIHKSSDLILQLKNVTCYFYSRKKNKFELDITALHIAHLSIRRIGIKIFHVPRICQTKLFTLDF